MTFDLTVHIGELLTLLGAALAILRGGIGLRDAVRELRFVAEALRRDVDDHENRLRTLEQRRHA